MVECSAELTGAVRERARTLGLTVNTIVQAAWGLTLAHHTGQTVDRIDRDTDRDFFMSAVEAKEYGLVDEVISVARLRPRVIEAIEAGLAASGA